MLRVSSTSSHRNVSPHSDPIGNPHFIVTNVSLHLTPLDFMIWSIWFNNLRKTPFQVIGFLKLSNPRYKEEIAANEILPKGMISWGQWFGLQWHEHHLTGTPPTLCWHGRDRGDVSILQSTKERRRCQVLSSPQFDFCGGVYEIYECIFFVGIICAHPFCRLDSYPQVDAAV